MSGTVLQPLRAEHPQTHGDRMPWLRLVAVAVSAALLGEVGSLMAARGFTPLVGAGVVVLTAALLHYRGLSMPAAGGLAAIAGWLIRGAMAGLGVEWESATPGIPGPETLYGQYLLLTLLLQALAARKWLHAPWRLTGLVMAVQVLSAAAEVMGREFWNLPLHLPAILETGALRSLLAVGLVYMAGHQEVELRWHETQSLNDRLWLLIIRLETEVFFLRKSASEVERVTAKSYNLYYRLKDQPEAGEAALDVAKDVHELKNDYQRILAGLDQVARYREVSQDLPFSTVVSLVIAVNREYAKRLRVPVSFTHRVNHDFVTADYAKWVSILNNLVTNAVEAATGGGHVHVESTLYPSRFIVTVADAGPGIPPQDWEVVFHPGYSTKANPVTGTYSVGLGLAHARSLAKELGGQIHIEDSGQAGTIFRLEFPASLIQAGIAGQGTDAEGDTAHDLSVLPDR